MHRTSLVLVVALAALVLAAPPADAKRGPTLPPPSSPAPTTAPAPAPAASAPHISNETLLAAARQAPASEIVHRTDLAPATAPRAVASPTAPTLERRLARFDAGGASAWPTSADAVGATAAVATAAIQAPRAAGWPWTVPVLGLFALGGVVASARLLRRPAAPAPVERMRTITLAPVDVRGILLAGKSAVEKGALAEAVAWFTQAIALQPGLGVAHFSKGVCLAGLGRHEDAYAALRAAYELDRQEAAIRLEYARAAARTGRAPEAMDALGPLLVALPVLAEDVADDDAFAGMRDHPRFLAMVGRL